MIDLPPMPHAQQQGWHLLFDLAEDDVAHWCLVGGQMVYLHAAEGGVVLPRTTVDVDVVADVIAKPGATRWLGDWLANRGFRLDGVSLDGIGHRFTKPASPGPGDIKVDVLAPNNVGSRATLTTTPAARTIEAPGTRQALERAEIVDVSVVGAFDLEGIPRLGRVRRPRLLAAILVKAAAAMIPGRATDIDFQDAAVLLAAAADPISLRAELDSGTNSDRVLARHLRPLLDPSHRAWQSLDSDLRAVGQTVLSFLLED